MIPPKSFLIDISKYFDVWTPNYVSEDNTIVELSGETHWPKLKSFVCFGNNYVLRESVLLQVIEDKDAFKKVCDTIETLLSWNDQTSFLFHMKLKKITSISNTDLCLMKMETRDKRPMSLRIINRNMGMPHQPVPNKCYVAEWMTKKDEVFSSINFIYNTTDSIRMGKPSWV